MGARKSATDVDNPSHVFGPFPLSLQMLVPGRGGRRADIVLGYSDPAQYAVSCALLQGGPRSHQTCSPTPTLLTCCARVSSTFSALPPPLGDFKCMLVCFDMSTSTC